MKQLIIQMAKTPNWGYSRILGELRKLGIKSVSRTTIRSILKEHGIEPSPDRAEPTWIVFLKRHASTLWSCDFSTKETVTRRGIKRQAVLVFMHITSRKVLVTRATKHPNNEWMTKVAECFPSMVKQLGLDPPEILVRDNDVKFTRDFNDALKREGVKPYPLPIQAPLMNAHIERWIKSLKVECLDHFIPVGNKHLDYLISEYVTITTPIARTRVSGTRRSCRPPRHHQPARSGAIPGSAGCSDIITGQPESCAHIKKQNQITNR